MARKKNTDHGTSYKEFDGYMTAWFMWQLQGKDELKEIFSISGELSQNSLYQDLQTNIK